MFYVYLLKSQVDGELYIGSTNDLKRRLKEHNSGQAFSTKLRKPFDLVYYEAYRVETDARAREYSLKSRGKAREMLKRRLTKSLAQAQ